RYVSCRVGIVRTQAPEQDRFGRPAPYLREAQHGGEYCRLIAQVYAVWQQPVLRRQPGNVHYRISPALGDAGLPHELGRGICKLPNRRLGPVQPPSVRDWVGEERRQLALGDGGCLNRDAL